MRADSERGWEELDLPPEVVTGEAVVLDLRPASFATRALALALDLIILGVVGSATIWLLVVLSTMLDDAAAAALGVAITVTVAIVVPVSIETLTRGRSIGKLAAGLRVVRDDGGPIRFRQALVRQLLALFEVYMFSFVSLIASLTNARGKRLGDLLAGTYVVRQRSGPTQAPPARMPPELAGWAYQADLGRLPDRLALAVRAFLGRAYRLHPASRQRLGFDLANQLAVYVAPAPPVGTHPEAFLAAVLAERRRRDLERLGREHAARRDHDERRRRAGVLSPSSSRLVGDDQYL